MNGKFKLILGLSALVLVIVFASMLYNNLSESYDKKPAASNTQSSAQSEEKIPAPDFNVTDMNGESVSFKSFVGKPIVINFWASWCPPCKSEMPYFNKVAAEMSDDVVFMMINSTDGDRETVDIAKAFLSEQSYTFPVYFDTDLEAAYAYGISSLPSTVFIDKDGNVVTGYIGVIDEQKLRDGIEKIKE